MARWTRRAFLKWIGGMGLGVAAGACSRALGGRTPTPSLPIPPGPGASPTPWPSATPIPTDTPVPASPTPAPTPTKTPWPMFPRPSKLGIVVQWFRDVHILNLIANTRMRVVKIIDDFGRASEIKAKSPNTILIGRIFHNFDFGEHIRDGRTDMRAAAEWYVHQFMDRYLAHPHIDYWEGHNEPRPHNHEVMRLYAQFEIERMKLMAERGLKCVIGNFPNGSPDLELWVDFLPALQVAKQLGGLLGLHEYNAPTMDAGVDPQTGEGWFTLRYRKAYRYMVPPAYQVPIVITETGIDNVPTFQGPPSQGWRNYLDYWARQGYGDPHFFYLKQLWWYDEELQKDDYVLGATIYIAGAFDHSSFEIMVEPFREMFEDYLRAHPNP